MLPLSLLSQAGQAPVKPHSKVSLELRSALQPPPPGFSDNPVSLQKLAAPFTYQGLIGIDAIASGNDGSSLLQSLQALGLTHGSYYKKVVSGFFPADKIDALETLAGLHYAAAAHAPLRSAGSVVTQGDRSMKADMARSNFGATGRGTKVGILSDSYNALGGAAAGVASGDLPADAQILLDVAGPGLVDEGRAMAELVHDIAPEAKIAFHTALTGQAGFANGIRALADAGCQIIVDDIAYLNEPFFQDGIIAQAVEEVSKRKVTYFSAAGNHSDNSYEAPFVNSHFELPGGWGQPHNFANGDWLQSITIAPGQSIRITLQWDDPFFSVTGSAGTKTDMDMLVFLGGVLFPNLSAIDDNLASGDPVEILGLFNGGAAPVTIELALAKYAGPDPRLVKWVNFANSNFPPFIEYLNNASTVVGHANAESAIAVGATAWFNTPAFNPALPVPMINNFSSRGGAPVFFQPDGKRTGLGTGKYRNKPDLVGPDGGNTTFFTFDIANDDDPFPNFFGTSAAAPHVAGVAALMQSVRNNTLSPAALRTLLVQSAIDMNDPATEGFDKGFDFKTGNGFVQADRAVSLAGGKLTTKAASSRQYQPADISLSTWPNPSSGSSTISGSSAKPGGTITITNMNGLRVLSFVVPEGNWQKQVNLQRFGKGIYLLQLNNGEQTINRKLLIQ
jgi:subtilisin family serine protease